MIRRLDPGVFRLYGSILQSAAGLPVSPNHHSIFLPEGIVSSYRTAGVLYLGPGTGMSILSVSLNGEDFFDFYLDKAVALESGVWFRLAGFREKATVRMDGSAMPRELGRRMDSRDFILRPRGRVDCIYTLLYQEKEAGFASAGETDPAAKLIYVDQGSLHAETEGWEILLEQGEMLLCAPGQWHRLYAAEDQAPALVTVVFDAGGMDWAQLCGRKLSRDPEAARLLRKILALQEQGEPEGIFPLLTLLLLCLQQANGSLQSRKPVLAEENTLIRRAQQHVQDHILERLTVPAVAAGVGVSASYLTALFHTHLGISPAEYIRRTKLHRSKQMIREGQQNFTEIAGALHYSTVQHFSRQFKQAFGMTPTEYGKSVRE